MEQPKDSLPASPAKPRRHTLFYLIVVLLSVLYLVVGCQLFIGKAQLFRNQMQLEESVARVVEILHDRNDMGEIGGTVYYERVITFEAEILSGDRKGEVVKVSQTIDNLSNSGTLPVSVGDKLFIFKTDTNPDIPWEAGDFCRFDYILLLIGLFLLGLLVFGRSKGVKTILSLAFTCLAVFVVFVPAHPGRVQCLYHSHCHLPVHHRDDPGTGQRPQQKEPVRRSGLCWRRDGGGHLIGHHGPPDEADRLPRRGDTVRLAA